MKIADGLYSMSQKKGGRVHAFLVEHGSGLLLIDTLYDANAGVILRELSAIGKTPQQISGICLTHSHKSHLGGLGTIVTMSGAPVYAGEYEIPIIEGKQTAAPVGFKLPKPFNFEVYVLQVALNAGIGKHTPVKVSERLKEGMKIGPLEVIAVPGHTPGCMAFWWPETRALIAGDTVSSWPTVDAGWPTFNLDPVQAKRSICKLAELNSCKVLCVGHGEPITRGAVDVLQGLSKAT